MKPAGLLLVLYSSNSIFKVNLVFLYYMCYDEILFSLKTRAATLVVKVLSLLISAIKDRFTFRTTAPLV